MAILKLTQHFEVTIGGVLHQYGSKTTAQEITIGSEVVFVHEFDIVSGTITELWSISQTPDFDFMWIESSQAGDVQFVATENAADQLGFVEGLTANIAKVFGNDDSADLSGGTDMTNIDTWETNWDLTAVIDRVEFFHSTGSNAKVVVAVFT